jgi:hypothetical protein
MNIEKKKKKLFCNINHIFQKSHQWVSFNLTKEVYPKLLCEEE